MSESQSENQQSHSPFIPTTTPTIERANRLMGLRAHPGFVDLIRISQDMVTEAREASENYPGWDREQSHLLFVRQQCARQHHEAFLNRIVMAIDAGLNEQKILLASLPTKSPAEVLEQGDLVRQEVLTRFAEIDETRAAGSY